MDGRACNACRFAAVAMAIAVLLTAAGMRAAGEPYTIVSRLAPGGDGGWDYLTVDGAAHRLFVSRATRVQVIDLTSGALLGEIPGTEGVHGIALATELGTGFASDGRTGTVTVFDLKTLAVTATVELHAKNPDAILYEPHSKRVFTCNGGSDSATAIDAATHAVLGSVALGGRPEFAVADGRGKIFVNLEDTSAIARIDATSLQVETTWPLAPGEHPSGLALDREHRRLFSVCHNQKMVVLDADDGRIVASLPIGAGVDGAAFDPELQLAFSSNGAGSVTVVHEITPERFAVLADVPTQRSARTIALDPLTHRLYLPAAEFGPAPQGPPAQHWHRPPIVPGSFVVLVMAPAP
jgi:YVTN family beta-propeller protein